MKVNKFKNNATIILLLALAFLCLPTTLGSNKVSAYRKSRSMNLLPVSFRASVKVSLNGNAGDDFFTMKMSRGGDDEIVRKIKLSDYEKTVRRAPAFREESGKFVETSYELSKKFGLNVLVSFNESDDFVRVLNAYCNANGFEFDLNSGRSGAENSCRNSISFEASTSEKIKREFLKVVEILRPDVPSEVSK